MIKHVLRVIYTLAVVPLLVIACSIAVAHYCITDCIAMRRKRRELRRKARIDKQ